MSRITPSKDDEEMNTVKFSKKNFGDRRALMSLWKPSIIGI